MDRPSPDEFLDEHGAATIYRREPPEQSAMSEQCVLRQNPAALPLPLVWFDAIEPVLDAKDFVQGFLIETGAAVVYGESNAGKTFWTTDLALHVAAGMKWYGRRVEQGGVIYCALEGGMGFRNRVAAWRKAHGRENAPVPFAAIPATLNLLDPQADTPRLIETIQAAARAIDLPVKLVVIDTLSRAMAGGNENAPDDMGTLVRNMDAIRAATGACVLFIHHSGKDTAKGARGHSLLRAAIDTEIEVKADDGTGANTATVVKQREMKKGDVFHFRLDTVVIGQNRYGEDVTTCVASLSDSSPKAAKNQKKLTANEEGWFKELVGMFAEPGLVETRVPVPRMASVLTLTREQVRAGYRRRGRFSVGDGGALTGADRERMRSMLNKLKDKGRISLTEDLVWLL